MGVRGARGRRARVALLALAVGLRLSGPLREEYGPPGAVNTVGSQVIAETATPAP